MEQRQPAEKLAALKRYFGHSAFRPGQESLVDALLAGRDVLGVMPTGAGKSVCYQLPAVLLQGVTLVVSPLISLMQDQVAALTAEGVPAACIHSGMEEAEYRRVWGQAAQGAYKLLYVAPERLLTEGFLALAGRLQIPLVAVDEAHCVSQWGQDFRPSYLKIAGFIGQLPARPAVGAFTATATGRVREDIARLLALRQPLALTTGFDRPNLYFGVVRPAAKTEYLAGFIAARPGKSGIVYCATRKSVEGICKALCAAGIAATRYHAGLSPEERAKNQRDFVYDSRRVMVATNAFGMGIDKSNVSFVVHYNMPKNLENYYQEAGRAGRDGEPAECVLLYSPADIQTAKFMIRNGGNEELSEEEAEQVQRGELERLQQMVGYCKTTGCLRSFILAYFGEAHPGSCGNCSGCKGDFVQTDITVEAQKILSAVARIEKKLGYPLGTTAVLHLLRGAKDQKLQQRGLDSLPTYGALRDTEEPRVRRYIETLTEQGYLAMGAGQYPVLRLAPQAAGVLFHGERVIMVERRPGADWVEAPARAAKRKAAPAAPADEGLLASLKALRNTLAQKEKVPAYIVFSNATLTDMAARQPCTIEQFLQVSGVGEAKARRYGDAFVEQICRYRRAHPGG